MKLSERWGDFVRSIIEAFCPHSRRKELFGGGERCRKCGKYLRPDQ